MTVARHVAGIATTRLSQLDQVWGKLVILAGFSTRLLGIGEDPVVLLTEILHGQLQLLHVCDSIVDTGFVCAGTLSLNVHPFVVVVVLPVLFGFLLFLLLSLSGLLLLLFVRLLGCFPGFLLVLLVLVLASTVGLVLPTLLQSFLFLVVFLGAILPILALSIFLTLSIFLALLSAILPPLLLFVTLLLASSLLI